MSRPLLKHTDSNVAVWKRINAGEVEEEEGGGTFITMGGKKE